MKKLPLETHLQIAQHDTNISSLFDTESNLTNEAVSQTPLATET